MSCAPTYQHMIQMPRRSLGHIEHKQNHHHCISNSSPRTLKKRYSHCKFVTHSECIIDAQAREYVHYNGYELRVRKLPMHLPLMNSPRVSVEKQDSHIPSVVDNSMVAGQPVKM